MRKVAGFVKCPGFGIFGFRNQKAGQWASVQDLSGGKRDFGQRIATGGNGISILDLSGRTGFRPGSCEAADPGPRSWTVRQTEASAEDPAAAGPKLRLAGPRGGHRDFGSGSAERRTARASALTGSPRGNRKERKLWKDPGGSAPEPPAQVRNSKPPRADRLAFQAWHHPRRDSGGWRRRQPPLFLAASGSRKTDY